MVTAAQWEARCRQSGSELEHDNDGGNSMASGRGRRRGRCYNSGMRSHFLRDCWKPKKAEEEKALLADINGVGLALL